MVTRGEMTADEARRFVDDMIGRAQESVESPTEEPKPQEPRKIEIVDDDDTQSSSTDANTAEALRKQMQALQDELNRLKQQ
jgi:polyhydroxyalkanoate synthesis regulator phasin